LLEVTPNYLVVYSDRKDIMDSISSEP